MSKRSFLLALLAVSAFVVASMVGVWLATREASVTSTVTSQPLPSPRAEAVAPTRADPVASGPWGSIGAGGPVALPTTEATASAAPEHHVVVTPLFPAYSRFESGKTATLGFQARLDSGDAARAADISVSVRAVPRGTEQRLPVRELGEGLYEAEFTPGNPGQLTVAVASHGAAAGIPVPVIVLSAAGTLEPRGAAPAATEAPPATTASRDSGETMRGRGRGLELGGGARGAGRR